MARIFNYKWFKARREFLKISREEMAKSINCHPDYIEFLEEGVKGTDPGDENSASFMKTLNCTLDDLFTFIPKTEVGIMQKRKPLIEGEEFYIDANDGTLNGSWSYLYFKPGDCNATLDGEFSASELHAIADYMDKHDK